MTGAEAAHCELRSREPWPGAAGTLAARRDEVHLWRATIDSVSPPAALRELSPGELERARHILDPTKRTRFVNGRVVLKRILGRYAGRDPRAIEIKLGRYGKPFMAGSDSPKFNVTHSGGVALYVFSMGHEVGIDLEAIGSLGECSELGVRFLEGRAKKMFCALPVSARAGFFCRSWTQREALLKACGKGLSSLQQVAQNLPPPGSSEAFSAPGGEPSVARLWHCHEQDVGPEMACTVVVEGARCRILSRRDWASSE